MTLKNEGFTLLEVIIAVTVMAVLSLYTARSIQTSIKSKAKIQNEIRRSSMLRDGLSVITRDVELAFNYRDINIELHNLAQKEREKIWKEKQKSPAKKLGDPPKTGESPRPDPESARPDNKPKPDFKLKKEVVLTHFIGEKDSLHFTNLNFVRSTPNSQVSNQAEVGYYLETCTHRINKKHKSQCLWRRSSPYIDDKVDEGGTSMVLLENVTKFELRYLGAGEEEWVEGWNSKESRDERIANKFPSAVEVTIELFNKDLEKDKPLAMTTVGSLRFDNNPEQTSKAGTAQDLEKSKDKESNDSSDSKTDELGTDGSGSSI